MEENKVFYNSENFKLCGILNKANESKTIVVICPANCSNKGAQTVKELVNKLKLDGINSFSFDYRCCGESTGFEIEYTIKGLVKDLESTLDYLKKQGFEEFILVGMSMGGRVVSLLNTKKYSVVKEIFWYPAIPILSFKERLINYFKQTEKEKEANKNGYACIHGKSFKLSSKFFEEDRKLYSTKFFRNKIPKLIVHGDKDTYVDYTNSIKLFEKCKNAKFLIVTGGTHSFSNSKESLNEAINITMDFIGRR